MKKKVVISTGACVLLIAFALNSWTFASAKDAVLAFCSAHGGARAHATIPERSTILLDDRDGNGSYVIGCVSCPTYLNDPRNISVLRMDWANNPYAVSRAKNGAPIINTVPFSTGDWGSPQWFKFSIDEGYNCAGLVIELYEEVTDAPGVINWKEYRICRERADPSQADFTYGPISQPAIYDYHKWWMPPFSYRSRGVVAAHSGKRVIEITSAGLPGSWIYLLFSKLYPARVDHGFANVCRPQSIGKRWNLIGANAVIFSGVKVEYD